MGKHFSNQKAHEILVPHQDMKSGTETSKKKGRALRALILWVQEVISMEFSKNL